MIFKSKPLPNQHPEKHKFFKMYRITNQNLKKDLGPYDNWLRLYSCSKSVGKIKQLHRES